MSAIESVSFDHTELLRFITAGSVDDGKSTLIGRLLHDSKSIFEDQLSAITHTSQRRGMENVDLSLLTDGLHRKQCCHIRKVEPLKRALSGKRAWITGLRRDQAPTRKDLAEVEFDADNGLHKFSPLLDWSLSEVWDYLKQYGVPYNLLHDKGYTSIGCAPCTRAITPGEDVRAGRWWWEDPEIKECGLHPDKRHRQASVLRNAG